MWQLVDWVPGSLTPWGVTPREVGSFPALRLRHALSIGLLLASVGSIACTRFLVSAWARAEGRVTQGYPGRGPRHPGVPSGAAWCAVLGPVPPGARCSVLPLLGPGQRAASSRGAFGRRLVRGARSGPSWRVEVEEGTRTGGRLSHPQPWAFLVLAPGLRQGWPSWCGVQRPVRGPPSCGTTRAHVLRRCMPIDRGVMAPFGVYDHAPGGSTPAPNH